MKFRLQKVLNVREIVEKQKQKEFSLVMQQLQNEKNKLNLLIERRSAFTEEMQFTNRISAQGVADHHSYLDSLTQAIALKNEEITGLEQEVEKKRQILLKATTDRKSIELLKEKARQEFVKEMDAKEQALIDEIAIHKNQSQEVN